MRFPIDLIPITLGEMKVIMGMYWLSRFGVMIDCKCQLVQVRIPIGGELLIHGEGA